MPEVVEVAMITRSLQKLVGKHLLELCIDENSRYSKNGEIILKHFNDLIIPSVVSEIISYGKKIIFVMQNGQCIMSSLGMEGHWVWNKENHCNLWMAFGKYKPRFNIIQHRLYYEDSRHFGIIEIFLSRQEMESCLYSRVGPDLLKNEISPEEWKNKLRKSKNQMICAFLMDQKKYSGIGNYLKSEILYDAKIHPANLIKDLSDEDLEQIRISTRKIILESYSHGGYTLATYWDADGKKGTYPVKVYGREKDDNKFSVQKHAFHNKRMDHFVEEIQILKSEIK